jgi:hypothetical protein
LVLNDLASYFLAVLIITIIELVERSMHVVWCDGFLPRFSFGCFSHYNCNTYDT